MEEAEGKTREMDKEGDGKTPVEHKREDWSGLLELVLPAQADRRDQGAKLKEFEAAMVGGRPGRYGCLCRKFVPPR